ncbi:hypothetical protein TNCV_188821 [Trichonephila clavipes]|nr:hypothetical protein TNCV_188821 [Trichonephila clavipes]
MRQQDPSTTKSEINDDAIAQWSRAHPFRLRSVMSSNRNTTEDVPSRWVVAHSFVPDSNSSRWRGVVVRKSVLQLWCTHHLPTVQNYAVYRQ